MIFILQILFCFLKFQILCFFVLDDLRSFQRNSLRHFNRLIKPGINSSFYAFLCNHCSEVSRSDALFSFSCLFALYVSIWFWYRFAFVFFMFNIVLMILIFFFFSFFLAFLRKCLFGVFFNDYQLPLSDEIPSPVVGHANDFLYLVYFMHLFVCHVDVYLYNWDLLLFSWW